MRTPRSHQPTRPARIHCECLQCSVCVPAPCRCSVARHTSWKRLKHSCTQTHIIRHEHGVTECLRRHRAASERAAGRGPEDQPRAGEFAALSSGNACVIIAWGKPTVYHACRPVRSHKRKRHELSPSRCAARWRTPVHCQLRCPPKINKYNHVAPTINAYQHS